MVNLPYRQKQSTKELKTNPTPGIETRYQGSNRRTILSCRTLHTSLSISCILPFGIRGDARVVRHRGKDYARLHRRHHERSKSKRQMYRGGGVE